MQSILFKNGFSGIYLVSGIDSQTGRGTLKAEHSNDDFDDFIKELGPYEFFPYGFNVLLIRFENFHDAVAMKLRYSDNVHMLRTLDNEVSD